MRTARATALAAFEALESNLRPLLEDCASGRELLARGYPPDVELASQLDASGAVPVLEAGIFRARPAD